MQEIHHRVKNNLQIISSLLYLQSQKFADSHAAEVFNESRNRIRSMALVHESLYQSKDFSQIDFAKYIRNLTASLFHSYSLGSATISLQVEADNILPGIDQASPCGLILAELVSNALKYAFPATVNKPTDQGKKIYVNLQWDRQQAPQQLPLTVGDNGIGFPDNINFQSTALLGLQLVNNLVKLLDGTITLGNKDGTELKITVPYQT